MLSLTTKAFGDPMNYTLLSQDIPTISKPSHILIKISAASINGHDTILASGRTKLLQTVPMPYPLGLDFSGVILAVGSAITNFSPRERVYGFSFAGGAASTHLLLDTSLPHALCKVPDNLTDVDAASLPAVAITAYLALKKADAFFLAGGLSGKTIFVPAGLSGVGSIALQMAKHLFGCRTTTAVSTSKIPLLTKYLGDGVVDQAVDYTASDIVNAVGKSSVDFVFDTTGLASDYLPLLKKDGFLLSIARLPPGSALKEENQSRVACIGQNVMDAQDAAFRTYAKVRYGATYVYMKTEPKTEDLEAVGELVKEGKVKAVVGRTEKLQNIEAVKEACMGIFKGKGGIGKFVITMDEDAEKLKA